MDLIDKRLFSLRRSKTPATEIRQSVATADSYLLHSSLAYLSQPTVSLTPTPNTHPATRSLSSGEHKPFIAATATPLDVEEILSSRPIAKLEIADSTTASPRRLREMLEQDVEVVQSRREELYAPLVGPRDIAQMGDVEPFIRDLVADYCRDWTVVKRRYANCSPSHSTDRVGEERRILASALKKQIYESDPVESNPPGSGRPKDSSTLQTAAPDPLVRGILIGDGGLGGRESLRNVNRSHYFINLAQVDPREERIEVRREPKQPGWATPERLSVKIQKLALEPSFEPIYGHIFLVDLMGKHKLSENFHFELSPPELPKPNTLAGRCRQAFFALGHRQSLKGVFLIIRLSKTLQGRELSDCLEPYTKFDGEKQLRDQPHSAKPNATRLGRYRMPMGWIALDIGSILANAHSLHTEHSLTESMIKIGADGADAECPSSGPSRASTMLSTAHSTYDLEKIGLKTGSRVGGRRNSLDTMSVMSVDQLSLLAATAMEGGQKARKKSSLDSKKAPVLVKESEPERPWSETLKAVQPLVVNISSFYRQEPEHLSDDELIKYLAEWKLSSSGKSPKLKSFPVQMKLELASVEVDKAEQRVISPEMVQRAGNCSVAGGDCVLGVLEFPPANRFSVNSCYRDLLYVYPRQLNLRSASTGKNNLTLTIKIQLMDSGNRPVAAIHGGREPDGQPTSFCYTSAQYHNKVPQFHDEVKLQLPAELDDGHYLLFTICHISCKEGKQHDGRMGVESPIGYTWLPLYPSRHLQTGDFHLPVSAEPLPEGICFLPPTVNVPNVKWLDGHKPLFKLSLRSVSTIRPLDTNLTALFRAYDSLKAESTTPASEEELRSAIEGAIKSRPEALAAYLYAIIDRLLVLITSPPYTSISSSAFATLCQLVKVTTMLLDEETDERGRSHLLASYIHHRRVTPIVDSEVLPTRSMANGLSEEDLTARRPVTVRAAGVISSIARIEVAREEASKKPLHEELLRHFVDAPLRGMLWDTACLYSWFFFELTVKSIAEYFAASNRFFLPRRLRFGDTFTHDVEELVHLLMQEVHDRQAKDPVQAGNLNASIAFFLRDLLFYVDRSFVIRLVKFSLDETAKRIRLSDHCQQGTLIRLRLLFMRVVCSNEHFLLLNLPFEKVENAMVRREKSPEHYQKVMSRSLNLGAGGVLSQAVSGSDEELPTSTAFYDLSPPYLAKHYLLGVVLSDLRSLLDSDQQMGCCSSVAVDCVFMLVAAHEADPRLMADEQFRQRAARMYLPLFGILAENGRWRPPNEEVPRSLGRKLVLCLLWTLKTVAPDEIHEYLHEQSDERLHALVEILHHSISLFEIPGSTTASTKSDTLSTSGKSHYSNEEEEARRVVGEKRKTAAPSRSLPPLGRRVSSQSVQSITLDDSSATETEELLQSFDVIDDKPPPPLALSHPTVRWRSVEVEAPPSRIRVVSTLSSSSRNGGSGSVEIALRRHLNTEVSLEVLAVMEKLMKLAESTALHSSLTSGLVGLLLHILSTNQSLHSLESTLTLLRALLSTCPHLIFDLQRNSSSLCSQLCLQLLKLSSSQLPSVRSQASGSIYHLMKEALHRSPTTFHHVKARLTIALSTIVSDYEAFGPNGLNEEALAASLRTLLAYSEADSNDCGLTEGSQLPAQVRELSQRFHLILTDTVKMRSLCDDYELLIDIMYRVARGYANSPDLRITWLLNIANRHSARANYAEAAQCLLHCAAAVLEWLQEIAGGGDERMEQLPPSLDSFSRLSTNVWEECVALDEIADKDGLAFEFVSVDSFIALMERAAQLFEKAQIYELVPEIYKFLLPVHETERAYDRLIAINQRINANLKRVEPAEKCRMIEHIADTFYSPLLNMDKRCFGTYFRVGFYGLKFGELNGVEFVYKEPSITKLSEISHRLEQFYADKHGQGSTSIIKDSTDIDTPKHLDTANRLYIQVTYVEPYFELWERRERPTHLSRNYNLRRFVYYTPFTPHEGRAHGSLREQYKRRTVLTTEHAFPYVKSRLRVVNKEQHVLAPIEVAIEDMERRTRELAAAVQMRPLDEKFLQMVLQGAIGTTVNQGPIHIARTFFAHSELNPASGRPVDMWRNKLRLCFNDFCNKCLAGLEKNEEVICPERDSYSRELRRNYANFTAELKIILEAE